MKTFEQHSRNFAWEVNNLIGLNHNVYLGGMFALQLHGFKIPPRETTDMDIIVYCPTERQIQYLESIEPTYNIREEGIPSDIELRSFKFLKNGMWIDILIEENAFPESDWVTCGSLRINPVNLIINAKLKYGREKDIEDIAYIIQHNFLSSETGLTNHSIKQLLK